MRAPPQTRRASAQTELSDTLLSVSLFADSPERVQIAIIGAGIGGLSAAAFLRARGFEVAVFERKSWPEVERTTQVGNGIHLYFHCARMLVQAGVPLRDYLTPLDIQMRRDDGRLRTDISRAVQLALAPSLQATKASVYSLLRQHLYRSLIEHTPRELLHCDKACLGTRQEGDEAVVDFADGSQVRADLVVGADGIHSVLADQLFGPRKLDKHGIVVIQGISSHVLEDRFETWVLHREGGTMGLVPVVGPTGELRTFWWITVADTMLDGDSSDLEIMREVSQRFSWSVIPSVVEATRTDSLERWYSQDKEPLRRWFDHRVVLLGDACHAANPFSGYGAGMSIEDGHWLATMLGEPGVLTQPERLAAVLRGYEAKRASYTAGIVQEARVLMRALHPTRRVVAGGLNTAWNTGLVGKLVARKFVAVFRQGLSETEWNSSERASGRLEL